jgi:hypothetical protein
MLNKGIDFFLKYKTSPHNVGSQKIENIRLSFCQLSQIFDFFF